MTLLAYALVLVAEFLVIGAVLVLWAAVWVAAFVVAAVLVVVRAVLGGKGPHAPRVGRPRVPRPIPQARWSNRR